MSGVLLLALRDGRDAGISQPLPHTSHRLPKLCGVCAGPPDGNVSAKVWNTEFNVDMCRIRNVTNEKM